MLINCGTLSNESLVNICDDVLAVRQEVWELGASSKGLGLIRGGLTSSTRSPIRATSGRSLLLVLPTPKESFLRKCKSIIKH